MTFRNALSLIAISVFSTQFSFAQTTGKTGVEEKPKVYLDGHQYPSFGDGSHYAWFAVHFPLTETSEISVGGEHYRTFFADRLTVPIQYKQYFSEKSYALGGYQLEWDLLNEGTGSPNPIPVQEVFFGIGHDIQPNMFLEAKFVQPLGKPKFNKPGFGRGTPRLELGGKWKF